VLSGIITAYPVAVENACGESAETVGATTKGTNVPLAVAELLIVIVEVPIPVTIVPSDIPVPLMVCPITIFDKLETAEIVGDPVTVVPVNVYVFLGLSNVTIGASVYLLPAFVIFTFVIPPDTVAIADAVVVTTGGGIVRSGAVT
jgi:hypothetical protein